MFSQKTMFSLKGMHFTTRNDFHYRQWLQKKELLPLKMAFTKRMASTTGYQDNVISNLEKSTNSLLNWFRENHMKANADKCHLLVSSDESCTAKIEDLNIKNSTEEKLLVVKFDSNLSFESHVTSLCKKARQKLHALARISHYMDLNKRRNLMKDFITSQFNYCPLIWMSYSRNRINERALRLVYQNNLSFSGLLDLNNSVTVHQNNLQVLVTEIYKLWPKNLGACAK